MYKFFSVIYRRKHIILHNNIISSMAKLDKPVKLLYNFVKK